MKSTDRYETIASEHGEGGFGKVSIKRDKILERNVAVKLLIIFDDKASQERFIKEAKTLARMSHPNVPAIYDVEFDAKSMELYFEYIEGITLQKIISEGNYPSMDEAKRWFTQVASALEHAHNTGIIHRDIKPANIIVSSDRTAAYLVDFGIALTSDDVKRITKRGYVIGTPGYMSPEQMAGEELDGRSDLYSLGITLYEALCGRPPQGDYKKLSDINESIPPGVDEIIKKCLAEDKEMRFSSAREFIISLGDIFRTGKPLSALLTDARLHELHAGLSTMSPQEFSGKPKGQKLLIIKRVKDLVRTDNPIMHRPTAEMIELLVRLAIHEPERDYSGIVDSAFEWGFEKVYTQNWAGDEAVRNALILASKEAPDDSVQAISKSLINFVKQFNLADKAGWYLHDLRLIVMALMANQYCDQFADELANLYDEINTISHPSGLLDK